MEVLAVVPRRRQFDPHRDPHASGDFVERAVREDLKDKTLCGFCMEPDAAKHAVGDVKVKPLGGDVYQTEIACLCRGATNGQTRVRILRREYAFVGGKAVCTMPNLGWQSPEDK